MLPTLTVLEIQTNCPETNTIPFSVKGQPFGSSISGGWTSVMVAQLSNSDNLPFFSAIAAFTAAVTNCQTSSTSSSIRGSSKSWQSAKIWQNLFGPPPVRIPYLPTTQLLFPKPLLARTSRQSINGAAQQSVRGSGCKCPHSEQNLFPAGIPATTFKQDCFYFEGNFQKHFGPSFQKIG